MSCFDGFGNDSRGFFAVYSELFEARRFCMASECLRSQRDVVDDSLDR